MLWGLNSNGQLGDGTITTNSAPTQVAGLANINQIAADGTFSLALDSSADVYSFGRATEGQLGRSGPNRTPTKITTIASIKTTGSGADHALALKTDGTLYTWGKNTYGQIGDTSTTDRTTPYAVPGLPAISQIGAGATTSFALPATDNAYAWGENGSGQLGDNTTTARTTPELILGLKLNLPQPTTAYTYDADGLRASKTSGPSSTHFTWDRASGGLPLLIDDGDRTYLYGPDDRPIADIARDGTTTYYHHDQLGSTRLLTDETGATAATYTYSDYGTLQTRTGTRDTKLQYAGQYTDPESGHQYLRARYYDPATGSFLTRDPLEPFTRDAYGYAGSDPVNHTDPSGLCFGLGHCPGIDHAVDLAIKHPMETVGVAAGIISLATGVGEVVGADALVIRGTTILSGGGVG